MLLFLQPELFVCCAGPALVLPLFNVAVTASIRATGDALLLLCLVSNEDSSYDCFPLERFHDSCQAQSRAVFLTLSFAVTGGMMLLTVAFVEIPS